MEKHWTATFENIPEDKRKRILDTATAEFAKNGFSGANINTIARNAGVSIGAMYKYFESKERLLLTVMEGGAALVETVISRVSAGPGDMFDKIEKLLRAAQEYSRNYPELHQIYLDITSEGNSGLSRRFSRTMESISAAFYRSLIVQGKKDGVISADIDEFTASFCIDNLVLMLQFSYTSEYFRERMKIFAGEDALTDDEKMIQGVMRFIRSALSPAVHHSPGD